MFKLLLIIILTLGFVFIYPGITSAVSDASNSGSISILKVDHVAGFFEKINEKISLFLKFNTEDKADYYQQLLDKRLAELQFVIKNGQGDLIEETSSRYAAYLGTTSNFIINNHMSERKNALHGIFESHTTLIKTLQSQFEYDSGWWLLLQHDINSIQIFSDKINNL